MASFSQPYSNMTMSMCLIFRPKTARDPRQRDMVAYFWTAPTAWFQGGTGSNSENSPCPSVTSYWCFAEGFYPTVFEHRTVDTSRKTTLKALGVKPQFSQLFFMGCLMEPIMMVNFLQYGFWENEFAVWIYHPLWRLRPTWPWVLITFLQNFSAVATS